MTLKDEPLSLPSKYAPRLLSISARMCEVVVGAREANPELHQASKGVDESGWVLDCPSMYIVVRSIVLLLTLLSFLPPPLLPTNVQSERNHFNAKKNDA